MQVKHVVFVLCRNRRRARWMW